MKNLCKVALVSGALFLGTNLYAQKTNQTPVQTPASTLQTKNPKDTINLEKISLDVEKQSDYGKTVTLQDRLGSPTKIDIDQLYTSEVKEYYSELSRTYELQMKKLGNVLKDYTFMKTEYDALKKENEALKKDKEKLQTDLKDCQNSLPVEEKKK